MREGREGSAPDSTAKGGRAQHTLFLVVKVVGETLDLDEGRNGKIREPTQTPPPQQYAKEKKRTTSTKTRNSVPCFTFLTNSVASHSFPSSTPPFK